jgi:hypothetical protein
MLELILDDDLQSMVILGVLSIWESWSKYLERSEVAKLELLIGRYSTLSCERVDEVMLCSAHHSLRDFDGI